VFGPLRRVKFLITAPFIVVMLFFINLMTSPGHWWVQWAALGIGIAWMINGWVQGMGFPPCCRVLTHWFPPGELATKMSIWNISPATPAAIKA